MHGAVVNPRRSTLRTAALAAQLTLAAAIAWLLLASGASAAVRALVCVVVLAPLLATLPALATGRRRVEPWLAFALVIYVGGTTVEVVARGGATLASVALLAAVTELGLLLALIRRSPRPTRADGG